MRIIARNRERIKIDGQDIEDVGEFTYLGATVCKVERWNEGPEEHTLKSQRCIPQTKEDLELHNISRRTTIGLYRTLVVPTLLYGSETWKMNKEDNKVVDVFQNKCL